MIRRLRSLLRAARQRWHGPILWARFRSKIAPISILVVVLAGSWGLVIIPRLQVSELTRKAKSYDQAQKAFELENEARKTLAQIILGGFGLIALYFTWRRVRANDRNVRLIEEGQITDRFTKAVEQLGNTEDGKPNIEVRLGGVYALERIAIDSPRDHWTIMEVLTAYIRRNSAWTPDLEDQIPAAKVQSPRQTSPWNVGEVRLLTPGYPHAERTDVQAILTVIGRRERGVKREQRHNRLNLFFTDLRGLHLMRAHLEGASLVHAHLEGANLYQSHLERTNFMRADLRRANVVEADLRGANLSEAHLEGADVRDARLEGADLTGAYMEGAVLVNAHLESAQLCQTRLRGAFIFGAHLEKVHCFTRSSERKPM